MGKADIGSPDLLFTCIIRQRRHPPTGNTVLHLNLGFDGPKTPALDPRFGR
jgi:hypothetical protein